MVRGECCVVVGRGSRIGHCLLCLKHKQLAQSTTKKNHVWQIFLLINGFRPGCSCVLRSRNILFRGRDARNAGSGRGSQQAEELRGTGYTAEGVEQKRVWRSERKSDESRVGSARQAIQVNLENQAMVVEVLMFLKVLSGRNPESADDDDGMELGYS